MNIDDTIESKYLKQKDIYNAGRGTLLTIIKVVDQNVAPNNAAPEFKPVVFFAEVAPNRDGTEKGMILSAKINKEAFKAICGTPITDQWIGHKVVLYVDPNVMNKGQITGGIRVRQPRNQPVNQPTLQERTSATSWQQVPPVTEPKSPAPNPDDY